MGIKPGLVQVMNFFTEGGGAVDMAGFSSLLRGVLIRAANSRGPGGPIGSLHTPSRAPGSSPDRESAMRNAPALVPGPLARL